MPLLLLHSDSGPIPSDWQPVDDIGDLAPVSLIWTGLVADPVNTAAFEVRRGTELLDSWYTPLGGDAWLVEAEAGLFPDEAGIQITASATSVGNASSFVTWTFSTRTSIQITADLELSHREVAVGIGGRLRLFTDSLNCLAKLGCAVRPAISAQDALMQLTAAKLFAASDMGMLQLSATRQILQLASQDSVGIGDPLRSEALYGEIVNPVLGFVATQNSTVYAKTEWPTSQALQVALPFADLVLMQTVEVGHGVVFVTLTGMDIESGDGVLIFVDLLDAVLSAVRD